MDAISKDTIVLAQQTASNKRRVSRDGVSPPRLSQLHLPSAKTAKHEVVIQARPTQKTEEFAGQVSKPVPTTLGDLAKTKSRQQTKSVMAKTTIATAKQMSLPPVSASLVKRAFAMTAHHIPRTKATATQEHKRANQMARGENVQDKSRRKSSNATNSMTTATDRSTTQPDYSA
jgi:hypothetical protein